MRELLNHTSGASYFFTSADLRRFHEITGTPTIVSGEKASITEVPLVHDPGTIWEYGTSTDWLGLLVEEVLQIAREASCEIEVAAGGMLQRRGGITAGPSLDILANLRDLRAAAREPGTALGRLVVVESPGGEPVVGRSFDLDSITTLGRDVNNSIVVDDPFASSEHAILTYRGQSWYVEDAGSTNGTYRNGRPISGPAALGFGDEIGIGQARLRLERARRG